MESSWKSIGPHEYEPCVPLMDWVSPPAERRRFNAGTPLSFFHEQDASDCISNRPSPRRASRDSSACSEASIGRRTASLSSPLSPHQAPWASGQRDGHVAQGSCWTLPFSTGSRSWRWFCVVIPWLTCRVCTLMEFKKGYLQIWKKSLKISQDTVLL